MPKSVIRNPETNKEPLLRRFWKAKEGITNLNYLKRIKRVLEYEEDKKTVDLIAEKVKEIDALMSDLGHVLCHDEYWADLRDNSILGGMSK